MSQQIHSGKGDNVAGDKTVKVTVKSKILAIVIFILGASGITIYLWPEAPQFSGYVVSSADIPLENAKVTLQIPGAESFESFTDDLGKFLFADVNPKKLENFTIVAQLEERTITQVGTGEEAIANPIVVKLPVGTPPFRVFYIDIEGFELDFIFKDMVSRKIEDNIGGQPQIVQNGVYKTLKDLSKQFSEPACENFAYYIENLDNCFTIEGKRRTDIKTIIGKRNYEDEVFDRLFKATSAKPRESDDPTGPYRDFVLQNTDWTFNGKKLSKSEWEQKLEELEQKRIWQDKLGESWRDSIRLHRSYYDLLYEFISSTGKPFGTEDFKLIDDNRNSIILDFYQHITKDGIPEDFFRLGIGAAECSQESRLLLNAPDLKLKVAFLENTSGAPIALDSFYIQENKLSGLRLIETDNENRKEAEGMKLLPENTLRAGGKVMIPLALQFTYRPAMRYDHTKDNIYIYGPSWEINDVKVGIERYPFRKYDPEVYVWYGGLMRGASCPFVYTYDRYKQEWVLEDHILEARIGPDQEGADTLLLKRFTGEALIKEEDPETSYIDHVHIEYSTKGGEKIFLSHENEKLKERDSSYYIMRTGDEVLIKFPGFDPGNDGPYYLISSGYYIPDLIQ